MSRLGSPDRRGRRPPGSIIAAIAVVGLTGAACADSGEDSTTIPLEDRDISEAQTCEEIADIVTFAAQQVLDATGTLGLDEEPSDTTGSETPDLFNVSAEAFERAETVPDCDTGTLELLLCERNPSLESHGPAGDEFKEFWFAPSHCEGDSTPTESTTVGATNNTEPPGG